MDKYIDSARIDGTVYDIDGCGCFYDVVTNTIAFVNDIGPVKGRDKVFSGTGLIDTGVDGCFITGKYNAEAPNAVLVVGCGTASARKNALVINKDGSVDILGKENINDKFNKKVYKEISYPKGLVVRALDGSEFDAELKKGRWQFAGKETLKYKAGDNIPHEQEISVNKYIKL